MDEPLDKQARPAWLISYEKGCDHAERYLAQPVVALLLALLFLTWLLLGSTTADPDLFARVAVGRLLESIGSVPLHDPFAFTVKKSFWIDHEWLSGVMFYHVAREWGDFGLFTLKLVSAYLSLAVILRAVRTSAPALKAVSLPVLLITGLMCGYVWSSTVRSQIVTYLCLPLFLFAFVQFSRLGRRRWLWLLPPLTALWANCHGGFVVGLGLLGVLTLLQLRNGRKKFVPLLVCLLACLIATCINPYGPGLYWGYVLDAVTMTRPGIPEWKSAPLFALSSLIPHLLCVCIVFGAIRRGHDCRAEDLTLLAVSAFFGYTHTRLMAIFIMVASVYGTEYVYSALQPISGRLGRLRAAVKRAWISVGIGIFLLSAFGSMYFAASSGFSLDYSQYPYQATEWLWQRGQGGRLLVDFNNGSFALWRLYPRYRVSVDGRYEELYPDETLRTVESALNPLAPEHVEALKTVRPDYILTSVQSPSFGADWFEVYRDEQFIVLSRQAFERSLEPAKVLPVELTMWAARY